MDITSYLLGKKSSGGGSGGLDWSAIGYSEQPSYIDYNYNYALTIKNNWVVDITYYQKFVNDQKLVVMPLVDTSQAQRTNQMFSACYALQEVPLLDTSNNLNFEKMFQDCYSLKTVPQLNTSKATNMWRMFNGCFNLTNETLENILKMCIGATSYNGTKTLAQIGLTQQYYPASRIQALPSYQDFIDAGWTIGY